MSESADRRDRARVAFSTSGVRGPVLVTSAANIRYLTGFSGSNAVLLLGTEPDEDLIGTDGRYADQVAEESADLPAEIDRATVAAVAGHVSGSVLGVETSATLAVVESIRALGLQPIAAPDVVEALRAVKEEGELALIERACQVTSLALEALIPEIRPHVTERYLARRLETLFSDGGGEDRAFPTIVASGRNSAIPHHQTDDTRLEPGDLVVIDAGARVQGYHADMTRTFVVGRSPTAEQEDMHAAVVQAHAAGVAACLPGRAAVTIDAAARLVLRERGLEDRFTHGLGHGVGLEIHEAPAVSSRATGTIQANMTITVEPGVYLPGQGGVRIEDTLVVADAGPRALTTGGTGLRVVGL